MRETTACFDELTGFSLVQGGPSFRLFLRLRLQESPTALIARRAVAFLILAWKPLLLLLLLSGHSYGGLSVPFLHDLAAQTRVLLCISLLLVADVIVQSQHRRAESRCSATEPARGGPAP